MQWLHPQQLAEEGMTSVSAAASVVPLNSTPAVAEADNGIVGHSVWHTRHSNSSLLAWRHMVVRVVARIVIAHDGRVGPSGSTFSSLVSRQGISRE